MEVHLKVLKKHFIWKTELVIASVTMIIIKTFYFNKAYIKYCNLLRMSVVKYVSVLLLRSVARVPVVLGSAPWTEIAPCFINKKKMSLAKSRIVLNLFYG